MHNASKDIIVREYLRQQQRLTNINEDFADELISNGQINVHHSKIVARANNTDEDELNEFKEQVKSWLKLDNEVKAINSKIKILDNERKHRKKLIATLSENILKFMSSNEIDELNSKDGVIKYKKSYVKQHLNQKQLIEKLQKEFATIENADEKINNVFKNREKIEKMRLLRS